MAVSKMKQHRTKMKVSTASKVFDFCNILFMVLFCITILFPFWDMIVRSFSRPQDISYIDLNLWPKVWSIDAYSYCLKDNAIVQAFFVSVARTVVGTFLHVIICCMAAYSLIHSEIPFRGPIMAFFVIPMFISGGMIPAYLNMKNLNLLNNFWVYVLPTAFSVFDCIIIRNYFFSIDKGMEEAASIDGANAFHIFFRIILPVSKPVLATVSLWQMVGQWNAWFDNMVYCRSNANLTTLQYTLRRMLDSITEKMNTQVGVAEAMGELVELNSDTVKAATTIIVTLPIILVYPFLQKYFDKGVMIGSVKG